jgi:hypothetical protein
VIDVAFAALNRLQAHCGAQFLRIGALAEVEASDALARIVPAAYVLPQDEVAAPAEGLATNVQQHDGRFSVLYFVRHAGDASGARAVDSLTPLREAVAVALVGWVPPQCVTTVQFVRGALEDFVDGTTVWRDEFTTRRIVDRTISTV